MDPVTLVIVPGFFGGLVIAFLIARWSQKSEPGSVHAVGDEPPPTDVINMARIRVAGIGGLGFVAMAVVVAIAIPRIGQSVAIGLVAGAVFAVVLIVRRRRNGPLTGAGGAGRLFAIMLPLMLVPHSAIADQSERQTRQRDRPVIGVYFDEPFKLLEPFARDFRRSCTCVENAFVLIPRMLDHDPGPDAAASLQLGDAVLRLIRDTADARWLFLGTAVHPRMLITGRGIPPLDGEAAIAAGVRGYLRLAQRGDRDAQAELGYLYAVGVGVPQSAESAAYWYGQAAAQNQPDAALALAAMYALGRGVPQDDRSAFYWLQRSNHPHFLADAYACGLGVEQDFDRARLWYEVMATHGSAGAQYQLGTMYLHGCGAPLDDNLAREWFGKAANMGHPEAQIALSEMMSQGWSGGAPDPWTAYVMADLAWTRLPNGDPLRAPALAARDRAAASLSPEEQANAQQAVRTLVATRAKLRTEWLKGHQRQVRSRE